jgi:cell division septation protein DedD
MASGGKRGTGDRVLESKHVIGLFLLMLLFSGVFFTLGYVMGRNQYGPVIASQNPAANFATEPPAKSVTNPKKSREEQVEPPASDSDPSSSSSSEIWQLSHNENVKPQLEERNTSVAVAPANATPTTLKAPTKQISARVLTTSKSTASTPLIPSGAYTLQVAALLKQDDALAIVSGLQKKHFAAFMQPPVKDKYYRVQVGPFKDQKTADAAKKGLEGEGFNAFYVKH